VGKLSAADAGHRSQTTGYALLLHSQQSATMLFKVLSAAVYGIDANLIDVEVDYSGVVTEKDIFHTVGLPDAAVRESRDRVRAAKLRLYDPAHVHHHQSGPR
jgi:hypothetical protein